MSHPSILEAFRLGPQWKMYDPFLFCAHHDDRYPAGDERMAPKASLAGRQMGMDFDPSNDWRMYHGHAVPGFPAHPHRGFETITLARKGFIDHSDSLGAAARFGNGDIQWLTAGAGIQHSEMFPLVYEDKENHTELFQIWLNLPAKSKMAKPHFQMTWAKDVPTFTSTDSKGKTITTTTITGQPIGVPSDMCVNVPTPPPDSWAADPNNEVRIVAIRLDADAEFTIPAASAGINRALYFFAGSEVTVQGEKLPSRVGLKLEPTQVVKIQNGPAESELLLMEGRPIAEPVAQHGPFVMNYPGEIRQAMIDYQATRFGGWPWPSDDPAHPRAQGRFARFADGRVEEPT